MSAVLDILPDGRCKTPTCTKIVDGVLHEALHCINCGKRGGWVPCENIDFASYVCDTCAEIPEINRIFGAYMVPDEVFETKVRTAQFELFGRELLPHEMAAVLTDVADNDLKRLKREYDARHRAQSDRF